MFDADRKDIMKKPKKQAARRGKRRTAPPAQAHTDPDDVVPQRYLDDLIKQRHEQIPKEMRERLLAAGFTGVKVAHGAEPGFYEASMERGHNQRCGTTQEAVEFFNTFIQETGGEFAAGAVGVLVQDSSLRVCFITPG